MFRKKSEEDQAVDSIKGFINELDIIEDQKSGTIWQIKVSASIKRFIGDSDLAKKFDYLGFMTQKTVKTGEESYLGGYKTRTIRTFNDNNEKEHFKKYLSSIIDHIKIHGISDRNPIKENIFSGFNNWAIIGGSLTYSGIIFAIGFYFGNQKIDRDYIDLKQENSKIEEKYNKLRDSLTLTVSKDVAKNSSGPKQNDSSNKK